MDSKELGFLFRVAVCCALDSTKTVHMGKPDTVSQDIISITLKHLDKIETDDIVRMYSMIHSYFNSYENSVLADSITVDDFMKLYQAPRTSEKYMAFADLLMTELESRTEN